MKKVLLGLGFAIIGYVLGCLLPFRLLLPIVAPNSAVITYYESASLWINGILALFTLFAVAIALFRDEIISLWRNVKLDIQPTSASTVDEVLFDESGTSRANQYKVDLLVWNRGSIDAKNCLVRLRRIRFETPSQVPSEVVFKESKVGWLAAEGNVITPEGYLTFRAVRIENVSREKGKEAGPETAAMYIGDNPIPKDYHNGKMQIEFSVSCENRRSEIAKIELKWDGTWKDRLADISKHLTVTTKGKSEGKR